MIGNQKIFTKGRLAILIVIAILLIDQAIKIWVKTSMSLHENIRVFDWFYIAFIENNGMAFPALCNLRPDLPRRLSDLVTGMLEFMSENRPGYAEIIRVLNSAVN